jgi:hypothetical protein
MCVLGGGYEYRKTFKILNFIFNIFTSKNYSTPLHRKNYKTLIIVNRKNRS